MRCLMHSLNRSRAGFDEPADCGNRHGYRYRENGFPRGSQILLEQVIGSRSRPGWKERQIATLSRGWAVSRLTVSCPRYIAFERPLRRTMLPSLTAYASTSIPSTFRTSGTGRS